MSGTERPVANCGFVTAQSRPSRYLARLCVTVGACLLLIAAVAAVLFARDQVAQRAYTGAEACGADPTRDCWVEISTVVVEKREVDRILSADEQVVRINDFDGLQVALTDGERLWSRLQIGDHLTLRLWHGDFVHASAWGVSAETTHSPLVGGSRWFAATVGIFGLAVLLLLAGLGRLRLPWVGRPAPVNGPGAGTSLSSRLYGWVAQAALATIAVGAVGMAATLVTLSAPLLIVTLLGLSLWALAEVAGQTVRVLRRHSTAAPPAPAAIPAQRATGAQTRSH